MDASSRVALVTGSAGGLGTALVDQLLAEGWRVAATSRSVNLAERQQNIWPTKMDVTNAAEVRATVEKITAEWGPIAALINNAGVTERALICDIEQTDWEKVMAVNLKGTFICSQVVLRSMVRQREGHIVNISSFSGRAGSRGQACYAAAKAGLFGLTASLAQEVGSRNIRVNAILPGVLPTNMTRSLSPEQMKQFADANSLKRINSVEEVARFIAFLLTTQNISGQLFQLDSRISPWT